MRVVRGSVKVERGYIDLFTSLLSSGAATMVTRWYLHVQMSTGDILHNKFCRVHNFVYVYF